MAATLLGLAVAVAVGFFLGAIASRSYGIYFLMITLAFSVLTYFFFAQVTQLSGFGGVNNVELPSVVGNPLQQPARLFYIALVVSAVVYVTLRYISRAPLGLAFQGVRDDPARMRALGYNVPLLRTVAFALGALVAGLAGVLSVWWNTRISPGSISLPQTIDLLVIAVIGGLYRLEGAWWGLVVTVLDNWLRGVDLVGNRFNTVIGAVFLAIVLISPGGLMGIWDSLTNTLQSRFAPGSTGEEPEVRPLTQEAHPPSDRPVVP